MSIPKVAAGYKRSWYQCDRCGNVAYTDYIPYSLSNPIITFPCGHQEYGSSNRYAGHTKITSDEALVKFMEQA